MPQLENRWIYHKNLNRFGFSRSRALQRKILQGYKCKNKNATLRQKNIEKTRISWFAIKILKNKKVEFQNTRTALTSFGIHEICQKSGHGVEWDNLTLFFLR